MTQITAYLSFGGNARAAMEFYKACLGGELTIQTFKESPGGAPTPDKKDQVMHSMLKKDGLVLMGSDVIEPGDIIKGNNITLCINGGSIEELKTIFTKLSQDGKVGHQLKEEFFGVYGDLTDKYGINWMFQADTKQKS